VDSVPAKSILILAGPNRASRATVLMNPLPPLVAEQYEALKRAAKRARLDAIRTNTGIVIVVDGKIVYVSADELREEMAREAESSRR